ncbi:DUF3987 domain-containing protein [Aurantimonas sp. E1-2-R+4]|uniref:DUF3987 domain-containing protein n=1 Tax=Aurantimonas sp. E1-2-R+4 TaxID=3113714 RepID=UPI002F936BF9
MSNVAANPRVSQLFGDILGSSSVAEERSAAYTEQVDPQQLEADADEMRLFAGIVFKRCEHGTGWVTLRAFEHDGDGPAVVNEWHPFDTNLVRVAAPVAAKVAGRPFAKRAVFSPPVCIFGDKRATRQNGTEYQDASEKNVLCAPVITVELDARPAASLAKLVSILGDPTLVVASGGEWSDPETGEIEDKLHLHWRLSEPAIDQKRQHELKRARAAAARLVDADESAVSLVHPMRWPGSVHTKGTPRLCRIIGGDHQRELNLEWALGVLEDAVAAAGLQSGGAASLARGERRGFKTKREWPATMLLDAARIIPNQGLPWDKEWNRIGMTFYDASHGSVDGLEAFHAWSAKCADKYDADRTNARWSRWKTSPPSELSDRTLLYEMRKVDPEYRTGAEFYSDFEPIDDAGPLDIFGDADPAELGHVPAGSLPSLLERWTHTEARLKGVPEAFAAISAVAATGAAIGSDIRIQVQQNSDSWTEGANLWVTIVAEPGSAKSPIIAEAVASLRKVDSEWAKRDIARHAEWAAASKRRTKDAPPVGPEPKIRRAVVDDVTAEKMIRIFADNARGILRAPDELVGMLGSFGAYKSGGDGDRSQFLGFFDGRSVTYDRVGAGTIFAEKAALTVLAGTQPDKMRELAKKLGVDGMLQRFIVVLHDGVEREALDEVPDRGAVAGFSRMIGELATAEYRFPPAIRMDPEAHSIFTTARRELKSLKHSPGANPAFKGHVEKWGKILPRLILIFHAAEQFEAHERLDPEATIPASTVKTAVRFTRFLMRHAVRFYETFFGAPETASEARWIAGFLLTRPDLVEIRRRTIGDARKSLRGPDGLRVLLAAMSELEGAGWCAVADRDDSGPRSWKIDPRVHARFADRAARERKERAERHKQIMKASFARKWVDDDTATSAMPSVFD